jgi:hypothetical protein
MSVISRRKLITSSVIAACVAPTLARAVTARTLLQGSTKFYVGTGGSNGNDGLTPATALPNFSAAISLLRSAYDLDYQPVEIQQLDGSVDPGFRISAPMVGQGGFGGLLLTNTGPGAAVIRPSSRGIGMAMDSGAMASIQYLTFDGITQGTAGQSNDCIQLGQGSHLALWGSNTVQQNSQAAFAANGFTIVGGSTVDIMPQSFGSPIQNAGHVHFQGVFQDGMQLDANSSIIADCNEQHGLIAFWADSCALRSKPYWQVAFCDVMGECRAILSGIDFHGTADGYRRWVRDGGSLRLNLANDPGQATAMFGSATDRATPVGFIS